MQTLASFPDSPLLGHPPYKRDILFFFRSGSPKPPPSLNTHETRCEEQGAFPRHARGLRGPAMCELISLLTLRTQG